MPKDRYYLPQRRLVSQDDAAIIERPDVPRSKFTGSWTRKTTFDAGLLVPFLVDEILPGDHMTYDVTAYVRMSTPIFPIFDNQRVDTFFFFVPNRLVWDNWVRMMGEQDAPTDSIDFTVPQLNFAANMALGTLHGYFIPAVWGHLVGPFPVSVNALPFRAYNLIVNTWFRDQNLAASWTVPKDNGPDAVGTYVMERRMKPHDYFTSALPWPQKFTAPNIPVAGIAPVTGIGTLPGAGFGLSAVNVSQTDGDAVYANAARWGSSAVSPVGMDFYIRQRAPGSGEVGSYPDIYADLSQATGVAINTFRQAFMIQALLERDARGGTRYTELIRSHFGVTNPDFRLQRPEYIGGGQTPITITPVAATSGDTQVVGSLGAAGTAAGQHKASYAATEHGFIIGLINVRTELSYQQGLHRMWSRQTRYDYYWPALAGLGEQAILSKEIFWTGEPADNDVFGYQERWHEYRTRYSEVSGMFLSFVIGTIDQWHLAQRFSSRPVLNKFFISDIPPMTRVLAAGATANHMQYLADILIHRTAVRPIPQFGTPAILGRF